MAKLLGIGLGKMFFPGFGLVMQIAILVVFILVVYWVIKNSQPKESALDILKRRYAQGELSKKEFEQLRKDVQ